MPISVYVGYFFTCRWAKKSVFYQKVPHFCRNFKITDKYLILCFILSHCVFICNKNWHIFYNNVQLCNSFQLSFIALTVCMKQSRQICDFVKTISAICVKIPCEKPARYFLYIFDFASYYHSSYIAAFIGRKKMRNQSPTNSSRIAMHSSITDRITENRSFFFPGVSMYSLRFTSIMTEHTFLFFS